MEQLNAAVATIRKKRKRPKEEQGRIRQEKTVGPVKKEAPCPLNAAKGQIPVRLARSCCRIRKRKKVGKKVGT